MQKVSENKVKSVLTKQASCAFVPKGVSMWPFIKNQKNAVIIKKPENEINLFDVVFYTTKDGREVLHRVIEFCDEGFITMGDGLLEREKVSYESVFGVMTGYFKGKKYIDAKHPKYLEKVSKWYSNTKKRQRKIKNYKLRLKIRNKIKLILSRGN